MKGGLEWTGSAKDAGSSCKRMRTPTLAQQDTEQTKGCPSGPDAMLGAQQCFRRLATSINEVSSLFPNWCKQGHPDSYHCGVPVVILCAPIFFKSRLDVSGYTF